MGNEWKDAIYTESKEDYIKYFCGNKCADVKNTTVHKDRIPIH